MTKKTDYQRRPDAEYRYFLRDPAGDGMLYFRSEQQRDEDAASVIESYIDDCFDDFWNEEVEDVITGTVTGLSTKYDITEPLGDIDEEGIDEAGEYWPGGVEYKCNYRVESIQPTAGRLYAVEFKDNSTGDGMLIIQFATMKEGEWFDPDGRERLCQYEGDEVLRYFDICDRSSIAKTTQIIGD